MSQIDEFIRQCEQAIAEDWGPVQLRELRETISCCYGKELNETGGYLLFEEDANASSMRTWLNALKEHWDHELAVANAQGGITKIDNSSSSIASAIANIDFKPTIDAINDLPADVLTNEDKEVLLGKLTSLETAIERGEKNSREKAVEIFKWIGEKSTDVITAVAPVLLKGFIEQ